jgi:hypothetical protein
MNEIIDIDDFVEEEIKNLRLICAAENLHDCDETVYGSGNDAHIFRAKRLTRNVVVRISTRHQVIDNDIRDTRIALVQNMNAHPQYFVHTYSEGFIFPSGAVVQLANVVGYHNNVYSYEIQQYLPGHPSETKQDVKSLKSLYRFARNLWLDGWSHGDFILRNLRYNRAKNTWLMVDLNKVHNDGVPRRFPLTVDEFYCHSKRVRSQLNFGDANNLQFEIETFPAWVAFLKQRGCGAKTRSKSRAIKSKSKSRKRKSIRR